MNSGTLQGIATILTMISFLGICAWAYSGKRKVQFSEAANLPFADDGDITDSTQSSSRFTPTASAVVLEGKVVNDKVKYSVESQKP